MTITNNIRKENRNQNQAYFQFPHSPRKTNNELNSAFNNIYPDEKINI